MYYSYASAANKIAELITNGTLELNGPCTVILVHDPQGAPNNITIRCNKDLNPQIEWKETCHKAAAWNGFNPYWVYSCNSEKFRQVIDSVDKGILRAKYGKPLIIESQIWGEEKRCVNIPEQGVKVTSM